MPNFVPIHTFRQRQIEEIQNHLNLVIIVGILFTTVISNLYQLAGDALKGTQGNLYTSAEVCIYILAYLIFEIFKDRIGQRYLVAINIATLVGIGVFIFPTLAICLNQNNVVNWLIGIPLVATLWALPVVAGIVLGLVLISSIIGGKN